MVGRGCTFQPPSGRRCGATSLRDGPFCFWHAPEREEEAAEARRLGGLRRRREKTVSGAYDFAGLGSVESIRRILEIVTIDTLGLENSIARARALIAATMAATKLLEVGELEDRLGALEATLSRTNAIGATLEHEAA
ncbi:MAG: hypothetical protein ACRDMH_13115 [Solirubrobacterales bacterium]